MKALIVDDERLARNELKRLLRAHPEIEIVGEASKASEAMVAIEELAPDLLFLDIQMPGKTGFDLLKEIPRMPRVIFTTAFDEFALNAFEFHPFDYLLKPIEPKRLALSLAQIAKENVVDAAVPPPEVSSTEIFHENDKVFVRDGDRCWLVGIGDISVFESEGNYTRVFFEGCRPLIYRSLNALEARLNPRRFFRASRKHIINLAKVKQIEPWFSGGLLAHLEGEHKIEVSRRQSHRFREMLSL